MSTFNIAIKRKDPLVFVGTILGIGTTTLLTVPAGETYKLYGITMSARPNATGSGELIFKKVRSGNRATIAKIGGTVAPYDQLAFAETEPAGVGFASVAASNIRLYTPVILNGGDTIELTSTGALNTFHTIAFEAEVYLNTL